MEEVLSLFKALSDETRLRVLKLLEGGELCVCDIVAALGMVQPKVSFHLAALKAAGLITDRPQGKWTHYRIFEGDLYRRFLVLSVLEKLSGSVIVEDRRRLEEFRRGKGMRSACVSGSESARPTSTKVIDSVRGIHVKGAV